MSARVSCESQLGATGLGPSTALLIEEAVIKGLGVLEVHKIFITRA